MTAQSGKENQTGMDSGQADEGCQPSEVMRAIVYSCRPTRRYRTFPSCFALTACSRRRLPSVVLAVAALLLNAFDIIGDDDMPGIGLAYHPQLFQACS